jgi:hypothetical protein
LPDEVVFVIMQKVLLSSSMQKVLSYCNTLFCVRTEQNIYPLSHLHPSFAGAALFASALARRNINGNDLSREREHTSLNLLS